MQQGNLINLGVIQDFLLLLTFLFKVAFSDLIINRDFYKRVDFDLTAVVAVVLLFLLTSLTFLQRRRRHGMVHFLGKLETPPSPLYLCAAMLA
jgi:hypothetical protein